MATRKNSADIRKHLIVATVIYIVLFLALELGMVVRDYGAALKNARDATASLSAALNEHADRAIGEADRMMQSAIGEAERAEKSGVTDQQSLHRLLSLYNGKLPQTASINLLNAKGDLVVSGFKFPAPTLNFADRDYFQHHLKNGDTGLFISRPVLSRTSGKWLFTLSRSVNNPDGTLKAVYATGILLDYFEGFYRSLNLPKDSRLALVRQDGWLLMRSPATGASLDKNLAQSPLFTHFRQMPAGSYHIPHSIGDGLPRIVGFASSSRYPFLAVVSLSEQQVLTKWRESVWQSVLESIVSVGLVLLLVTLLWRYMNRLNAAHAHMERQGRSLARSERRYQQLVDGIDGIVWEATLPDLCFTYVSANAAGISGYAPRQWQDDPRFWQDRLGGPADAADIVARIERHGALEVEHSLTTPDGKEVWLRNNITLAGDAEEGLRLRGVMIDNTERRQAFEALEQAAQVFETSLHAVMIFSTAGSILRVNQAFLAVTGFTEDEVIGRDAAWFESHFLQPGFVDMVRESLRVSDKWQGESPMRIKDGSEIIVMQSISVIRDDDGRALSTVAIFHDITGQKDSEKRLYQLAHFDPLTQLPNRQALADKIRHAIGRATQHQAGMALLFIDIDHFKTINDSLGHDTGDRMLVTVGERIAACLGSHDTLARSGGDEFVVLLEQLERGIDQIERVAESIARTVAEPVEIGGKELYVSMSMGISVFPQDGSDAETLLRNADTAMYRAKAAGRNCWRFFDESMARHAAHRLDVETALRRAVERKELVLHYQPQRSLESGKIVGIEALLRWVRPGVGTVPPLEFIPLAEESGLILPIGNWVLHAACTQAAHWMRDKGVRLRVAVNVAAKQIHDPGFVEQVRAALEQSGLPPDMLELEITESSIVENTEETAGKLRRLKELGVTVAIDDFGTGYSSLSYLKQLPIDRLKIDRSFVKDTPGDADDCAIVRTIIAMSNNLGLAVIAEGVESQAQVDFLAAEGCGEIQGYWLSKPLPAEEIGEKLN